MDIEKQIAHWKISGQEDMSAAWSLWEKGHWRHSLFFAHLALEKTLKAHYTKHVKETPPRIHSLIRLADMATIKLSPEQSDFLRTFNLYQLEGRYPGAMDIKLDQASSRKELTRAREMVEWLIQIL